MIIALAPGRGEKYKRLFYPFWQPNQLAFILQLLPHKQALFTFGICWADTINFFVAVIYTVVQ
jgi:hypothetical protein